jgi:hypothetical protein
LPKVNSAELGATRRSDTATPAPRV